MREKGKESKPVTVERAVEDAGLDSSCFVILNLGHRLFGESEFSWESLHGDLQVLSEMVWYLCF